jgi:CHAD domain-containing protein
METLLERETKWEVNDGFELPAPDEVAGDAAVDRSTVELASVYYDTADHDLLSRGVTLRRRDGDDEVGWQLKVPEAVGRLELRAALADTPPPELADLLTGLLLGKPLIPVATIRTRRHRYRIIDPQRDVLRIELVDDHIRASTDHQLLAWREIEVEEGPAAGALPQRLARRLIRAGARQSRYPSKLARVCRAPGRTPSTGSTAQAALTNYVGEQIDAVFAGDVGLRRGHDPIHDTRVATRRLRSTVRVFGKLFDPSAASDLDVELKWFAGLLGEVRDGRLQRRRFHDVLDELPTELVLGPVAARVDSDLRGAELRARRAVTDAMDSARYLGLLATLQRWQTELPLARRATRNQLDKRAGKAQRKADRRLAEAIRASDGALLHKARKAAKRARYAAELRRNTSMDVTKTIKHFKRIQRVLGDYQDSVVAAGSLYRLGIAAGTAPGENGFTFGLLYARERQLQAAVRGKARRLA